MNISCFLFGHPSGDANDSGFPECGRCRKHAYYDNKHHFDDAKWPYYDTAGILFAPWRKVRVWWMDFKYRVKWRISRLHFKCEHCGKRNLFRDFIYDKCRYCGEDQLPF